MDCADGVEDDNDNDDDDDARVDPLITNNRSITYAPSDSDVNGVQHGIKGRIKWVKS